MKSQIRKMTGRLLAVGLLVTGLTTGTTVYAANIDTGAAGASADSKYSLEEMLVYAMEDEYLAQTEYEVIMDTYGVVKPFSNIVKAETTHISLLEPLFEEYDVSLPKKDWKSLVIVPETLDAAYAIGVGAEEKNIAMYESFLKENLPDDVSEVFEALKSASEKHLATFERKVDGVIGGNGSGNGSGSGSGNGNGSCIVSGIGSQIGTGNQRTSNCATGNCGIGGNRNTSQENCILE